MTKHSNNNPRKRWIIVGLGIVLALIFALQIAIRNHQAVSAPPIVEHQIARSGVVRSAVPAPEVKLILDHGSELGLSDRQTASVRKTQREWQAKSTPLISEMNRAAAEFQSFMSRSGGKATMGEIQSHAAGVSELSRQVSSLRRVYWQRAMQELTAHQKQMVEHKILGTHG
jgi:hypothetical protein